MVVGLGRGDVVGCFLREDLSEVGVFCREGDFGFRLFSGDGEFCCYSEFDNEWGVWEKAFTIASENPVNLVIVQRVLEVLILHVMVQVFIEVGVVDGVYINMAVGARKGFSEEGVMPLGISSVGRVKIL